VALAVLVPSIVISVLSSLYFPPRQMEIGLQRLKERAHAVGLLAQEQAAAVLAGPEAERTERLQRLFNQVEKGGGVSIQAVVGLDAFTSGAVRFRRYRSLSPFVGPSMGILGVVRFGSGDIQFDGQFGLGLIAGMEHTLASGRRIRYRFEYTRSVTPVHSKTVGDEFYPGGRAGGIYLTVGTSRGF
jgi:hypothetical protein